MSDFFKTVKAPCQAQYKEKMSRFLAFVEPIGSVDDAKALVKQYQNRYHDARHVCWAYMLGTARDQYLSSDNGEPSGTAGKPILGQINSFGLTNVIILVVRYFGGIKLGTSGLISAYREAARLAIEAGEILECHEQAQCTFTFPYLSMNDVMSLIKREGVTMIDQQFDNVCRITIQTDADRLSPVVAQLSDIGGVSILES